MPSIRRLDPVAFGTVGENRPWYVGPGRQTTAHIGCGIGGDCSVRCAVSCVMSTFWPWQYSAYCAHTRNSFVRSSFLAVLVYTLSGTLIDRSHLFRDDTPCVRTRSVHFVMSAAAASILMRRIFFFPYRLHDMIPQLSGTPYLRVSVVITTTRRKCLYTL